MRALIFDGLGHALRQCERAIPKPGPQQLLVRVRACAVCRTDLHILDGELCHPKLPLIPGHEIVATVIEKGEQAERYQTGDRVGIPWLGWTCGECDFCRSDRENLCERAAFTGYTIDGGYADYAVADERFCFRIPDSFSDIEAAPLLCAGLIGYRSLVKTGDAKKVGLYGFGAAAHIVAQVARFQGRQIFVFTRPGDAEGQEFARRLGCVWAGDSETAPPEPLDAAIIFAPAGTLIPRALQAVRKGGSVICGGIHMSDIPSFPYAILWGERTVCSVANLTRRDASEFLELAPKANVRIHAELFPMKEANDVLNRLRKGKIRGAAVLVPD